MAKTGNMSLSTKFILILSALLIGLFLVTAYLTYQKQQGAAQSLALAEAQSRSRELITILNHMSSIVRDEPQHNYALVPEVVTNQIAQKISKNEYYSIRQVALAYRNPANKPDAFETRHLEEFRPGEKTEIHAVVDINGKKVFRYMQAQIADQSCLVCHGTYESAPTYIQERFPKGHPSYNDKVGDIMGAVSFTKPMGPLYAELAYNFKQDLSYRAGVLLLFILVTYLVVRRLILGRLKTASATIHKITTTGSLNERIPITGSRDEIGQLLGDFNEMMAELNRTTLQREESEIRYRALIEATRSAIVTFLDNGKIVISNQKAEQLLGLSRERLLGENFFDYLDEAENLQQNIADLIHSDKGQNHKMTGLCHIRDAHGRTKEVKIVLVLASDAVDKQMFTAILRDPDSV
ncbi:MAG: DUF3365 domain-containing protein [Desulfuromonadaceae bacterium]|nr:DUF3365 domain-containing protein [Desulfuromonadaceae bacterium]